MKPCTQCGTPTQQTRCPQCTPPPRTPTRTIATNTHDTRWKKLSLKLRKKQPFCIDCHTNQDLTADHILPIHTFPDLAYTEENIQIRCRRHNAQRGNTWTQQEQQQVITALQATYNKKRTRSARQAIDYINNQGGIPHQTGNPIPGKSQSQLFTSRYKILKESSYGRRSQSES